MVYPRMRAWVAGVLFVAWLGYLSYLAYEDHGRVLVAGPQVERSNLVVVASLTDSLGRPAAKVTIRKILRADDQAWQQLAGRTIELDELAFFSKHQGWSGPGEYVVPLTRRKLGFFELGAVDTVTLLPLSPAYYPATTEIMIEVGPNPDGMAKRIAALTGTPVGRLAELFHGPRAVLFNVPYRGEDHLRQFRKLVGEAGGEVLRIRPAEARIYPATADVLRQVEAVLR